MTLKELATKRFSARKFTDEAVSKADIDYIMDCVRLAPSACNRQPWKFLVITSDEAKEKIRRCYDRDWFKTAPMYVLCMKDVNNNWVRPDDNKPHGDIDLGIAVEHITHGQHQHSADALAAAQQAVACRTADLGRLRQELPTGCIQCL